MEWRTMTLELPSPVLCGGQSIRKQPGEWMGHWKVDLLNHSVTDGERSWKGVINRDAIVWFEGKSIPAQGTLISSSNKTPRLHYPRITYCD